MRAMSWTAVGLVAWLGLALAPVSANATPQEPVAALKVKAPDQTIADRIEARLHRDASLKKFDIDVSVDNGVATLTGKVNTAAQKARAARYAHVTGVTRVENKIELDKDAGKGVMQKAKEGTEKVGEKAKEGATKTGEVITDAWITTKVKTSFVGEDLLKGSDINVDTSNHIVTLKGTVKTEAGRARAIEIAKQTNGVTRVVDRLIIK